MKSVILFFGAFFMQIPFVHADSPVAPMPLVFTTEWSSDVFFSMIPGKQNRELQTKSEDVGIAYRLQDDGTIVEIYRTTGWYSFNVHISEGARYLVQIGPWALGTRPSRNDLAVAFRKEGGLLRSYSTDDLVADPNSVVRSVSHYEWIEPIISSDLTDTQRDELRPKLSFDNRFTLNTTEGYTYVFDVTTGEILSKTKRKGK